MEKQEQVQNKKTTEKRRDYKIIRYTPWLVHFNTGACNGCDIEVVAALTPRYDPERLGVKHKGSPRHADILLLTGSISKKIKEAALKYIIKHQNQKL